MRVENRKLYVDLIDLEHVVGYCGNSLDNGLEEELWVHSYTTDDFDEIVYVGGQSHVEYMLENTLEERDKLAVQVRELKEQVKQCKCEYEYVIDIIMGLLADIRKKIQAAP